MMSSVAHAFLIASGHPFLDSCHGRFVSPLKVGIFQVRHQHRCYLYAEARRSCLSNDCLSANYISRSNYSSNGLLCESKVTHVFPVLPRCEVTLDSSINPGLSRSIYDNSRPQAEQLVSPFSSNHVRSFQLRW